MIFEGTLDRYPGLKIVRAHAGGYTASYGDRSHAGCIHLPGPLQGGDIEEEADRVPEGTSTTTPSSSTPRRYAIWPRGSASARSTLGTDYPFPWSKARRRRRSSSSTRPA